MKKQRKILTYWCPDARTMAHRGQSKRVVCFTHVGGRQFFRCLVCEHQWSSKEALRAAQEQAVRNA